MKQFIEAFESKTGVTVSDKFENYSIFFTNGYQKLRKFYSGELQDFPSQELQLLEQLYKDFLLLRNTFQNNSSKFISTGFNQLQDLFEDCITQIETTQNLSRYLRSSITNSYNQSFGTFEYTLREGETLESFSRNLLGSNNPENDWIQLSQLNNIEEQDYSLEGGLTLTLFSQELQSLNIISMVDNLNGESIYGKDINKQLTFQDEDLLSLDYRATLLQTIEILLGLKKGSNPEFFDDGVDDTLVIGANISTIQYFPFFRQLVETIFKDDSFRSLSITNLSREKDGLKIEFQLVTRLGEIEKTFKIF